MFSYASYFRTRYSAHTAAVIFFLISFSMAAQSTIIPTKSLTTLPGVVANSTGTLSFHGKDIHFSPDSGSPDLVFRDLIAVSNGDERVETGGATGKIARTLLPYGSGLALGAVTHKKVGLLTIEFLDSAGEYRGAVFELKPQDMPRAMTAAAALPIHAKAPQTVAPATCSAAQIQPDTVRVEVIPADDQSTFPAEDRVLLYERLVHQLESEKTIANVYRAGDPNPISRCAEFTVTVTPSVFTKGDQAVRASVGPLGHFVGTTKLSFHLTVAEQNGTCILDEQMKKSEGSDSDSLNITRAISKTVLKNLKKSRNQLRKSQLA